MTCVKLTQGILFLQLINDLNKLSAFEMWQIAYSLIFRVYSRNYGHECKVDLILTVGPIRDLLGRLNREAIERLPN